MSHPATTEVAPALAAHFVTVKEADSRTRETLRAGKPRLPLVNASPCPLRRPQRLITAHDAKGNSTILSSIPEQASPWQKLPAAAMFLAYTTQTSPIDLRNDTEQYTQMLLDPPGLSYGTSVFRIVDIGPGDISPLHRTETIDYGVIIEGRVELILDNCTRLMERGDICVQRATMHAWRNPSDTEWARIAFVLIPCGRPVVNGQQLGESIANAEGGLREVFSSV